MFTLRAYVMAWSLWTFYLVYKVSSTLTVYTPILDVGISCEATHETRTTLSMKSQYICTINLLQVINPVANIQSCDIITYQLQYRIFLKTFELDIASKPNPFVSFHSKRASVVVLHCPMIWDTRFQSYRCSHVLIFLQCFPDIKLPLYHQNTFVTTWRSSSFQLWKCLTLLQLLAATYSPSSLNLKNLGAYSVGPRKRRSTLQRRHRWTMLQPWTFEKCHLRNRNLRFKLPSLWIDQRE